LVQREAKINNADPAETHVHKEARDPENEEEDEDDSFLPEG
jgi:hypothetical protein